MKTLRAAAVWLQGQDGARPGRTDSFTLTELLAVTLIIVLMTGLVVGLASYVQTRVARSTAASEMAMVEAACESHRADRGQYPTSTLARIAFNGSQMYAAYTNWTPVPIAETENAALLCSQLTDGGYISPGSFHIKEYGAPDTWIRICSTSTGWSAKSRVNAILDPWGQPYNYYCVYPRPTGVISTEMVSALCTYPCQVNISGLVYWVTCNTAYGHLRSNGPQVNLTFDLWSSGPNRVNNQGASDDLANFIP